jgi:hypothetical protein
MLRKGAASANNSRLRKSSIAVKNLMVIKDFEYLLTLYDFIVGFLLFEEVKLCAMRE